MARAYYNENDAETAAWLQWNIDAGLIAPGFIDMRSIVEVQPDDLVGFDQHHFFAGVGGWSYAARLARWADERPIWSASCPCQPFSAAGKGRGTDDPRHLWPHLYRLWRSFRPAVGVGEQVAGAPGYGWFDGVRSDLAREGVASRVVDIPALAVDAPHQRNRLYWVAVADSASIECGSGFRQDGPLRDRPIASDGDGGRTLDNGVGSRLEGHSWHGADLVARSGPGGPAPAAVGGDLADDRRHERRAKQSRWQEEVGAFDRWGHARGRNGSWWAGADWIECHDGKVRRVADAGAPMLVDGFPNRVLAWRGFGNAIVPPLAAEVIAALMDVIDGGA